MNPDQQRAATAPMGYVQIVAGPGTGKTYTLINRFKHFLETGLESRRVVAMTFTNQAVDEIRSRVGMTEDELPFLGTFHKVAIKLLRQAGGMNFGIASVTDQRSVLKDILAHSEWYTVCFSEKEFSKKPTTSQRVKRALNLISKVKSLAYGPDDREGILPIMELYDTELKVRKLRDFDDLLVILHQYLEENEPSEVGQRIKNIAKTFQGVLVDEFQDTNKIQLDIASFLAKASGNLTVVGDPDQSIYGFRSAKPKNFLEMRKQHPDCQTYFLGTNYRSTSGILKAADAAIGKSKERLIENTTQLIAKSQLISQPYLVEAPQRDLGSEISSMASQIEYLINSGVTPNEVAILARRRRDLVQIEAKLTGRGIPVRVVGGNAMASRQSVSHLVDYLRVAHSEDDDLAIARIINVPSRKLGPKTIAKMQANHPTLTMSILKQQGHEGVRSFLEEIATIRMMLLQTDGVHRAVKHICSVLWPLGCDQDEEPFISAFESQCLGVDHQDLPQLLDYWSLGSSVRPQNNHSVTLTTIHSAKGLEWPVVYLIISSEQRYGSGRDDEEIRLLYVAITRACIHLVVYQDAPHSVLAMGMKHISTIDQAKPDLNVLSAYLGRPIKHQRPTVSDSEVKFISAIDLPETPLKVECEADFKPKKFGRTAPVPKSEIGRSRSDKGSSRPISCKIGKSTAKKTTKTNGMRQSSLLGFFSKPI